MSSSENLLTFKEIFRDFIKLAYSKGFISERLKDIRLSELSIIRLDSKGMTLYKLESGASFKIPWEWTDIFHSFSVEYGAEMEVIGNRITEQSDYFERFGYLINGIITSVFNSTTKFGGDIALFYNRLNSLIDLGTKKFIDWSKEELKITLRPFEFLTINDTVLI